MKIQKQVEHEARFTIRLTREAQADIAQIVEFLTSREGRVTADRILDGLEHTINSLNTQPNRGPCPPELAEIGVRDFREVFFKPYRIIYRIFADQIVVMVVTDGRRDMKTLLSRRMLAP